MGINIHKTLRKQLSKLESNLDDLLNNLPDDFKDRVIMELKDFVTSDEMNDYPFFSLLEHTMNLLNKPSDGPKTPEDTKQLTKLENHDIINNEGTNMSDLQELENKFNIVRVNWSNEDSCIPDVPDFSLSDGNFSITENAPIVEVSEEPVVKDVEPAETGKPVKKDNKKKNKKNTVDFDNSGSLQQQFYTYRDFIHNVLKGRCPDNYKVAAETLRNRFLLDTYLSVAHAQKFVSEAIKLREDMEKNGY